MPSAWNQAWGEGKPGGSLVVLGVAGGSSVANSGLKVNGGGRGGVGGGSPTASKVPTKTERIGYLDILV